MAGVPRSPEAEAVPLPLRALLAPRGAKPRWDEAPDAGPSVSIDQAPLGAPAFSPQYQQLIEDTVNSFPPIQQKVRGRMAANRETLNSLLKRRLDAARAYRAELAQRPAWRGRGLVKMAEASADLLEAELELAEDATERVAALQRHVEDVSRLGKQAQQRVASGDRRTGSEDLSALRIARIKAQLALHRELVARNDPRKLESLCEDVEVMGAAFEKLRGEFKTELTNGSRDQLSKAGYELCSKRSALARMIGDVTAAATIPAP